MELVCLVFPAQRELSEIRRGYCASPGALKTAPQRVPEKVGALLGKGVVAVVYTERKYPWQLHLTCDKAPPAARDSSEVIHVQN